MADDMTKERINGLCYRCVFKKATREVGSGPMSRWLCEECFVIENPTSNQCAHASVKRDTHGWRCDDCLRTFFPSGDTGAEQETVRIREALRKLVGAVDCIEWDCLAGKEYGRLDDARSIARKMLIGIPDETTALPSHEALADHLRTLTASTNCPVCGKSGMHEHTPTELIIYRNGVKYGRSLYQTAPVGTPRIGQCEATVPAKWHTPEHLCEFEATTEINGQKFCGHHLKSSPEEPLRPLPDHLKAPVKAGDPCPTFDAAVHEAHEGKCMYCGAPMAQVKASGEPSDTDLIEAAAELHHRLEMGQVDLDAEAKRALYSNISRLTRR